MQRTLIIISLCAIGAGWWFGCAHQNVQELNKITIEESKNALIERVNRYWAAIVSGDAVTQQELKSPRYKEKELKLGGMGEAQSFNIINYSVDAIELDPDGRTATVVITNSFLVPPVPKPKIVVGQLTKWELLDGVWYPQYKEATATHISGVRRQN